MGKRREGEPSPPFLVAMLPPPLPHLLVPAGSANLGSGAPLWPQLHGEIVYEGSIAVTIQTKVELQKVCTHTLHVTSCQLSSTHTHTHARTHTHSLSDIHLYITYTPTTMMYCNKATGSTEYLTEGVLLIGPGFGGGWCWCDCSEWDGGKAGMSGVCWAQPPLHLHNVRGN